MKYLKAFNEHLTPMEKSQLDDSILKQIRKYAPEGITLQGLIEKFQDFDQIMDSLERLFESELITYLDRHYIAVEGLTHDLPEIEL